MEKKKPEKKFVKKFVPNKKILIIIGIVILLVVVSFLVYYFVLQPRGPIRSSEDVGEAVTGIGSSIENIASILDDIDNSLG